MAERDLVSEGERDGDRERDGGGEEKARGLVLS